MDFNIAKARIQKLSDQGNFLLLVSVCLLIANILLVFLVGYAFMHQKRTIIPPEVNSRFTISDYRVDASYLRQMGLFFAAERLDITPDNVTSNHNVLLQYTAPEFYHAFLNVLEKESAVVTAQKISSVFYPVEVKPYPKRLEVEMTGVLKRWVGSLALAPENKSYLIKFSYKTGDLRVLSFAEVGDKNNG